MKKFFATSLSVCMALILWPMQEQSASTIDHQIDGPYVFYQGKKIIVQYIQKENGIFKVKEETYKKSDKENIILHVLTDQPGVSFDVPLQKKFEDEKTDYLGVDKIFVVSDIEGEFWALRKLLQANGVIDKNFNWTFGNGHLVLTGDFVDRGDQVTEVLWLIYSLEEKAEAAGGHVHFILGNHEIMNLSNDLRYVHPKYIRSATILHDNYAHFFSENAELGRWLRTKNVAERVGKTLFLHAGISNLVNQMQITLGRMNRVARPYYDDSTYNYDTREAEILYSAFGPFWFRGYYMGKEIMTEAQIDTTLQFYNVDHIATGHTVIADTVSVLHHGKLFDTDVHHKGGHSEGLYIEGDKFYRADTLGNKILIWQ